MAEEQVSLIPVVRRPPPLSFRVVAKDGEQPFLTAGCNHRVHQLENLMLGDRKLNESRPTFKLWQAWLPLWVHRFLRKECILCAHSEYFKEAIVCSYCGDAIFPGDPVSCYIPGQLPKDFDMGMVTQVQQGFVGCMGSECCPSGSFFAGHWVGNGVRSPFRGGTAAAQCFLSGEIVTVSNVDRQES